MNNQQNPYNQMPSMGQPMMPPAMPPREQWPRRAMNAIGNVKNMFPIWLSQYPVVIYIVALAVVSFMYSSYSLPWYYQLSGIVGMGTFFLYGKFLAEYTSPMKIRREKNFERRIFLISFVPRAIWMFLIYSIFMQNYGDSFGFDNADAVYYDLLGGHVADMIGDGNFHFYDEISKWSRSDDLADMGYGIYVGLVYFITGKSIIAVRLLKCVWSSMTAVLVYRLAKRNFGEQTGRIAAAFIALWPNFWYYCGTHLKETEMVFLGILFVEQADQMMRSRQFTTWKVVPILLLGAVLFTFRTPLGFVALLSLVFSVVMSSQRVVSWGKRIIIGFLAILLIGVTMGNRLQEKANALIEDVRSGEQQASNDWRSRMDNGNTFAKYAGASVFAPMIFTMPFPSMVRPFDGQEVQQLLNGGNYVKNIISAFTILAIVTLLLTGKWRDHLLPLSFMLGYLVVLTMSTFAQSERFHQPAMPFEFMFAAYGLSIAVIRPKYKRWFMYWCAFMFVACVAWNWFKIAGRGLA